MMADFYEGTEEDFEYWLYEPDENKSKETNKTESEYSDNNSDFDSEESEDEPQELSEEELEIQLALDREFYKQFYKEIQLTFEEFYSVKSPSSNFEFLNIYDRLVFRWKDVPHHSLLIKPIKEIKRIYFNEEDEVLNPTFIWSESNEQSLRHILNHIKRYTNADYAYKVHFQGHPAIAA